MKLTGNMQRGLSRCIGITTRFLRKARDFYVDSMINAAGKYSRATLISQCHSPENFGGHKSTRHDHDENLEELYQKLLKKYNWGDTKFDRVGLKQRVGGYRAMDRSYSVAVGKIGTINEEEPCEFEENVDVISEMLFTRSRSHAVTMKNGSYY